MLAGQSHGVAPLDGSVSATDDECSSGCVYAGPWIEIGIDKSHVVSPVCKFLLRDIEHGHVLLGDDDYLIVILRDDVVDRV